MDFILGNEPGLLADNNKAIEVLSKYWQEWIVQKIAYGAKSTLEILNNKYPEAIAKVAQAIKATSKAVKDGSEAVLGKDNVEMILDMFEIKNNYVKSKLTDEQKDLFAVMLLAPVIGSATKTGATKLYKLLAKTADEVEDIAEKVVLNNLGNFGSKIELPVTPTYLKIADEVTEYTFSKLEVEKYGEIVYKLAQDTEIRKIAGKWGIGGNGESQLLKHTLGKIDDPKRFAGIEKRAGLEAGTLQDVLSNNPTKVSAALKEIDKYGDIIESSYTQKIVIQEGKKEIFWLKDTGTGNRKGSGLVKYEGKRQSIQVMRLNAFEKEQ